MRCERCEAACRLLRDIVCGRQPNLFFMDDNMIMLCFPFRQQRLVLVEGERQPGRVVVCSLGRCAIAVIRWPSCSCYQSRLSRGGRRQPRWSVADGNGRGSPAIGKNRYGRDSKSGSNISCCVWRPRRRGGGVFVAVVSLLLQRANRSYHNRTSDSYRCSIISHSRRWRSAGTSQAYVDLAGHALT